MRFRRRVTEVEAERFSPADGEWPHGMCKCSVALGTGAPTGYPHVHTANGPVPLSPGTWVIPESSGEGFYPITQRDLDRLYEKVEP